MLVGSFRPTRDQDGAGRASKPLSAGDRSVCVCFISIPFVHYRMSEREDMACTGSQISTSVVELANHVNVNYAALIAGDIGAPSHEKRPARMGASARVHPYCHWSQDALRLSRRVEVDPATGWLEVKKFWLLQVAGSAHRLLGNEIQTVPALLTSPKLRVLSLPSPAAFLVLTFPSF
jgi:hypothetical protein